MHHNLKRRWLSLATIELGSPVRIYNEENQESTSPTRVIDRSEKVLTASSAPIDTSDPGSAPVKPPD